MRRCKNCGRRLDVIADFAYVITSAGLCQRCDMKRREALQPGCPAITGEYAPTQDAPMNFYPLRGINSLPPPSDGTGGSWDDVVRAIEEDR